MLGKVAQLSEADAACLTGERLLPRVRAQVGLQAATFNERAPACLALRTWVAYTIYSVHVPVHTRQQSAA